MRVGLLFGGQSGEHAVSMMSARALMNVLGHSFQFVPIAISQGGDWITGQGALSLMEAEIGEAPDIAMDAFPPLQQNAIRETEPFQPKRLSSFVDVVLPLLHGPLGEDGTMQGLLE